MDAAQATTFRASVGTSRQDRSGADQAVVAWHSIATCHYLVARSRGDAVAREFVLDLMRYVDVAPASADAIRFAASLPMDDFEDAMQVAAARFCGARRIESRNLKDSSTRLFPRSAQGKRSPNWFDRAGGASARPR